MYTIGNFATSHVMPIMDTYIYIQYSPFPNSKNLQTIIYFKSQLFYLFATLLR